MMAVIFEVYPAEGGVDEYPGIAVDLRPMLDEIEAFISIERFQSLADAGKLISVSFWRDEAAIAQWRPMDRHGQAQAAGRETVLADHRLRLAEVLRDYGLAERDEAPSDSRKALGS